VLSTDKPPVAKDLTVYTNESTPVTITLTGTDPEGDPFYAKIFAFPNRGTLYQTLDGVTPGAMITDKNITVIDPQNRVIYVPEKYGNGDLFDLFAYELFDGQLNSLQPAVVLINVIPVANIPEPRLPPNKTVVEPNMELPIKLDGFDPDVSKIFAYIKTLPTEGCGELYQVIWRTDGRPVRSAQITGPSVVTDYNNTVILVPHMCGSGSSSDVKFGFFLTNYPITNIRDDSNVTRSPEVFYEVTVTASAVVEQVGNVGSSSGPMAASSILALLCVGTSAAGLVWFLGRTNRRKDLASSEAASGGPGGEVEDALGPGAEINLGMLPIVTGNPRDKNSLEELLLDPSLQVVSLLSDVTQITEADELAKALVHVFEYHHSSMVLLRHFILREVAASTSAGTLFRSNSMASKMIKVYSFLVGSHYLKETIGQPIQEICSKSVSHELDPVKLGPKDDAMTNAERLNETTQNILDWILTSVHNSPLFFKWISYYLFHSVGEKYPAAKYTAVGGFLFLRYWCPAVTTPESYGLVAKPPQDISRRTLVLVAKVLQNLANGVMFGGKEEFMTPMNKFIEGNTESIKDYFENMSVVRSLQLSVGAEISEEDRKESLGVIHRHLAAGLKKMQQLMNNAPDAPTASQDKLPPSDSSKLLESGNTSVPSTPAGDAPPTPFIASIPASDTPREPFLPTSQTMSLQPSASAVLTSTTATIATQPIMFEGGMNSAELFGRLTSVLDSLGPPPERKKK